LSHSKERAEKICLNCNEPLHGRFCHVCGQENVEPKESVWALITHFFHDITHFDGKFFDTLRYLLWRPGFLSREYVLGRRARYLNPVRMYVFTSAIFFLMFFSFFFSLKGIVGESKDYYVSEPVDYEKNDAEYLSWALKGARNSEDSARITSQFNKRKKRKEAADTLSKSGRVGADEDENDGESITGDTARYRTVAEYDSAQKKLPSDERDGWFTRAMRHREIELGPRFRKDKNAVIREWINKFMHSFPQLLFVSLPLIALVLQLLYIRRRKDFYYVSHGIFLIHIYIYSFINLLLFFALGKLRTGLHWNWVGWIQFLLSLHAFWYVYKAMRNFYKQGRWKTIGKFLLLNFITLIVICLLFMVFLALSIMNL